MAGLRGPQSERSPLDQYGALHGAGSEAVAWRQARGGLVQIRPAAGAILSPRWLASLSLLLDKLCPESDTSHEAEGSLARRLEQGLSLTDEDSDEAEEGERSRRSAEAEAATSAHQSPARLRLSLRLERLALEDADIAALAAWCLERRARISLQSLWLFDNRCTDAGAEAIARLVGAFPEIEEVHLSHNRLTVHGAIALLEAVAAGIGSRAQGPALERKARRSDRDDEEDDEEGPNRAVWLRLEWNRIQLGRLCEYLEAAHTAHGLKADIPLPVGGASWCAPLPDTAPDYMLEAAAALREGAARPGRAAFAASPGCAGRKPGQGPSKLQNLVARCHVRLPWLLSQLEAPSEAAVLRSAKRLWLGEAEVKDESAGAKRQGGASGPLLLFPDTSVLLAMLGAPRRAVAPCLLSLAALGRQAAGGPGPASDRVHVVVSDSVMKQVDGMKKDPVLGMAVRRFFSTDLDTLGPAGLDVITVLGAHEGEGLLAERGGEVTGSRSVHLASKGQRADHRIVEVALFFQTEILAARAAQESGGSGAHDGGDAAGSGVGSASPAAPPSLPVVLVSADNMQVHLARAHGLPAARTADLNAALAEALPGSDRGAEAVGPGRLSAAALRAALSSAACAGLAAPSEQRSLRSEFREAVGLLEQALAALRSADGPAGQELAALKTRIDEGLGRWRRMAQTSQPGSVGRWAAQDDRCPEQETEAAARTH